MESLLPSIRPYAPPDLYPLVECWFHTWHATFAPRRHPDPIDAWRRRFQKDYATQAEVWLSTAPNQVAAFMVLLPEAGWLEQLFVHPDYQGRGLGRALLALARFRCPGGVELDTPAENTAAREFYRRRGFAARQVGFDPVIERVVLRYGWPTVDHRRLP